MTYVEIIKKYLPRGIKSEKNSNLILFRVTDEEVVRVCTNLYSVHTLPLKTLKATDERKENGVFKIFYIFGIPYESFFLVPYIELKNTVEFPSLVGYIHEASMYEREIHSFFGLKPIGHPDLRPFILHENWPSNQFPLRKDFTWNKRPEIVSEPYEFQKVSGEGIYEI